MGTASRQPPLGAAYWRLWVSSALSNLADGVLKVALPLVALQFTRSPVLIAGMTVALTIPWLLFALPAGAFADRLDRRRAMLAAEGVRLGVLATLTLAVLLDAGSIWALYAAALCIGAAETLYDTSAKSILPQIVGRDQLSRGNGRLFAAELTANEFAGPPAAGLLVSAGVALGLAVPVALWLGAVAALVLVRGEFRVERPQPTSLRTDVAEGVRFLWRHRLLRTLAAMTGGFNFATNATLAVFIVYAVGPDSVMGMSERAFGVLLATIAAGSIVGSFVAEFVARRLGRARSLVLTVLGCACLVGVPAVTASPYLIGVVFFIGGGTIIIWNVITVSLRQRITPDRLLGRVNSGYRVVAWGAMPLGAAVGGVLGQFLGLRSVFLVMGLLMLTLLAGMRVVTEQRMDAAERDLASL